MLAVSSSTASVCPSCVRNVPPCPAFFMPWYLVFSICLICLLIFCMDDLTAPANCSTSVIPPVASRESVAELVTSALSPGLRDSFGVALSKCFGVRVSSFLLKKLSAGGRLSGNSVDIFINSYSCTL